MCPTAFILQLAIVLMIGWCFYVFSHGYKNAKENFNILASLIDSPRVYSRFFGLFLAVEGYYKGRKVGWSYFCLRDDLDTDSRRSIRLFIEPKCRPKRTPLISLTYPTPTKETYLKEHKIYFILPYLPFIAKTRMLLFNEQELIEILNKLTEAVAIVEANPSELIFRLTWVNIIIGIIATILIILGIYLIIGLCKGTISPY